MKGKRMGQFLGSLPPEQQTVFLSLSQCFIFHHISINYFGIEVESEKEMFSC
jgi:hypothetical protein